ncbi:hypothetical protein AB0M20_13480 [Actinoplanes sp. NPDC051633]|uniref:hypothetical protein n=1 Tax=Actinoplanes sp. NPDC051633 TaxID=3155670 RepID=UPI0034180507
MNRQSTLPSRREQARHALLLLGVPAPARLVVEVHAAFFDGDLSVPALAALLRDEERAFADAGPWFVCPGLNPDLTAARGTVTLSAWSLDDRLGTPAVSRAHHLVATVRVAEFAAARPGAGPVAHDLLRRLAGEIPGARESITNATAAGAAADLAALARVAIDDPALAEAVAAEEPARAEALARAAQLDDRQRLFGLPPVPHQRGRA